MGGAESAPTIQATDATEEGRYPVFVQDVGSAHRHKQDCTSLLMHLYSDS